MSTGMLAIDLESLSREDLISLLRSGPRRPDGQEFSKDDTLDFARANGFAVWEATYRVEKFHDALDFEDTIGVTPDEVVDKRYNLLMYGGVSCLWETLIGNGTGTGGQNLTYFNNANAAIGVGDSSTATAATQTDLQASVNKIRAAMVSTYPQHTDGVISSANTITFQASFGNSVGNFAWNECAVFNSATLATGRMLNRLAPGGGFGTKAGGTWTLTVTITIS